MINKFLKFKNIKNIKRNRGIFSTRVNKLRLDANERISKFENNFINRIKKKFRLFIFQLILKQKKYMICYQRNIIFQDIIF